LPSQAERKATVRGKLLITSSCLLLVVPPACAAAGPVKAETHATRTQAVAIRLSLPRRYSCTDLERKVADVFDFAGARDVSVRAFRCEAALGGAFSPEVRVRYSWSGAGAATATSAGRSSTGRRTVRIEPGQPKSITTADCVLMRRLRPFLPGIVGYRLACRAPVRLNTSPFYVMLAGAQ
jgi:hypothetical protein